MDYLWVGIGGFVGANMRFAIGERVATRYGHSFPYGTLAINISGSFLIGLILTVLIDRTALDPMWRLLLVVGVLGGYTTFSSYTFEAITLLEHGEWTRGIIYVVGSNLLGLLACIAGVGIARAAI